MNATVALPGRGLLTRVAVEAGSERTRRWIVLLCLLVIVLLVGEGAIRKWVAPGYGRLLFFVRDPFVLAIYAIALVSGWWPRGRLLLNAGLVLGAMAVLLVGVQLMAGATALQQQAMLAVYGWRNYFFYLPLLFVIGATFRRRDLGRVAKLMLVLAIPIGALVILQFLSPAGARINVGISDDVALQFKGLGLAGHRTRPMGPFTSDVGLREYCVATTAIALTLWLAPKRERLAPLWLAMAGTAGVLACLAASGSRGAVTHIALVLLAAVASAVVMKASAATLRALVVPPVLLVLALWLYPVVFPEGHEAFSYRWAAANAIDGQSFQLGIVGRGLYNFVDFFDLMGTTPVFGYGLGLAGNASILLGVQIEGFTGWTETDWARHVVDLGPLLGPLYMLLRVAVAAWLGWVALRALRTRGDPLALLLTAFAGLSLLQGQLTGHGTVNGFAWIFGGLALAAATAPRETEGAAPPAAAPPRFPHLLR